MLFVLGNHLFLFIGDIVTFLNSFLPCVIRSFVHG
uniref:Uncharacterized protein n=1 Tax=Rhizophora mucronata TaxID=61149 RepID=A0A2P2PEG1_RHIMU